MITKGKIEKTAKKKKKKKRKRKKKANRISWGGVTRPLSQLESYSQSAPSQTRAQDKLRTIPILWFEPATSLYSLSAHDYQSIIWKLYDFTQ